MFKYVAKCAFACTIGFDTAEKEPSKIFMRWDIDSRAPRSSTGQINIAHAQVYLDAGMIRVIGFGVYIPAPALIGYFILGNVYTLKQWMTIGIISLSSALFVCLGMTDQASQDIDDVLDLRRGRYTLMEDLLEHEHRHNHARASAGFTQNVIGLKHLLLKCSGVDSQTKDQYQTVDQL